MVKAVISESPQTAAASPSGTSSYFEFTDSKSSKFWEITSNDTEVTTRYGRIGSDGTTHVKTFADANGANAHVQKVIEEKTGKAYVER